MIRSLLLIFCALILQNHSVAQPKIEKSSRVKFGGKMPFRDKPFIFESGDFTYVTGGDYNSGASRLVFKLAKFNNKLKCIKKFRYKYKRRDGFYEAGYRYLSSGKYLSFFYSDRTQENTKIYAQKVNLEKMEFEGKPRLLLDLNSNDDWFNREISCIKSPDGNFMLLVISGEATQAQYLFDNKENLVYVKRHELKGYKLFVTNEGKVVGIKDEKAIDKNVGIMRFSIERPKQEINRFALLVMDKDGKPFYKNYTPEANIYHRYRQWIKNSVYSSYNGITQSMDVSSVSSVNSTNQLSYQFKLRNNMLYFVSFVTCEKFNGLIDADYTYMSSGIFVSKFEVTDTFKNTGKLFTFTQEQSDNLFYQTYSSNKSTMNERIRQVKDLNACGGRGFPTIYMDGFDVDDEDNLSIFGSSYTNNSLVFKTGNNSFPYERKNYHYFRIDKEILNNETGTASILFEPDMFFQQDAFVRHSDKKGYSALNVYKSLELDPKKTDHDDSKKMKFNDRSESYYIWSESGQLYRVITKNMDVVLRLYRISPN
jgi:hypothetical protein